MALNLSIAGIQICIDDVLADMLPRKMHVFIDSTKSNREPRLQVRAAKGLFCSVYPDDSHPYQMLWHGHRFSAAFCPSHNLLLIPIGELLSSGEPAGFQFCLMQFLRMALGQTLLRSSGFILHASALSADGQGLLFSGLSGSGKSTQARLWEKYEGAEIINHDSPMIICEDGLWYCYGNPWSGSDDCYKQMRAPVRCVAALWHGEKNRISGFEKQEALRFLMTQSLTRLSDERDVDLLIANMSRFLTDVPVIRYDCLPDRSAVTTLKEYLSAQEE